MYKTEWEDFEDYHECIISLRKGHSSILKLTALKVEFGWQALIKDHLTGLIVGCSSEVTNLSGAMNEADLLSYNYIKNHVLNL